ncbi:MAG: calcium/sodium antiporter [Leptolyngbyaceae cyanobacterium MO_188.B28]|nr:calcium/sodium antiporter [Leptolyngbyaceae cyanobacterium MO_188.B28]
MSFVLVFAGILLLYLGGEVLVRSSSRLAFTLGLSPLVVGLTVVAFGTSSPELLSSLVATLKDASDIAMGNVVGSNSANLGLVLGLSTIIYPLRAKSRLIRREALFMIVAAVLLIPFSRNLVIGRAEGLLLFGLLVIYLIYLFKNGGDEAVEDDEFAAESDQSFAVAGGLFAGVALGIGLLVIGAQSLVTGAIDLAHSLNISERAIGLSIVAFGTSLPELASCLVAAIRREGDLLIGNLIGSNIFNILGILGLTAAVEPIRMSSNLIWLDLWVAIGLSIAVLSLLKTRLRLARLEGSLLLIAYLIYIRVSLLLN